MSELSPVLNNEAAPTISPAPVVPAMSRRSPFGAVLGTMALAISLGSAGLVGWFFYSWQPQLVALQQQQGALSQQQQQQQSVFERQQQQLQQDMQQQLVNVVADLQAKAQEQGDKNQQELAKLQLQLDQQSGNVKGWQLLEVDYFLRLAEQKLFLEQNVAAVVQVLELAEQRLKQMQDASLVAVREAIGQDKRMLAELNTPDMHQLHLTLSNLRQQSLTLPLRQSERAMDHQSEQEITEDAADWQANLALYWRNFWRGLIQVRASLPEDGVSLTAEQQISVRNTLTQQLLLAELAAMQHNQAVYAAAIQQSADSLQRYFAATEPTVQQMADELVLLSALQVSLPLLAPLKSPQLFDAYRQGADQRGVGVMIRLALLIAILGLAMLLGPVLANHPGYVMLVVAGVTIEATFVGLMLVLLLTGLACWLSWVLCKRLFDLPRLSFSFLRSRKERRARQALQQGMLAFVRQDWQNADQYFSIAKAEPEWQKMKQIMACYSAQKHGDLAKANQLAAALETDDPDNWLVVADLYLQQQQPARAVSFLSDKIVAQPKDSKLGRLWLQALTAAGQWQTLLEQVPLALKQQWYNKAQWQQLRYQLYPVAIQGLAAQGQFDENAAYWQQLPAKERKSIAATLGKVWAKAVAGQPEQAEKLLLDSLALADLMLAWPVLQQIPLGRSVLQLRKQAQHWLRDHSNNGYLYAVLSYCAAQEGEAEQAAHAWQKALQYQPELACQAATQALTTVLQPQPAV